VVVAGIAWTGAGFDVAFRDATGAVAEPALHVPAGRVGELTTALLERDRAAGQGLVCVVDSTNGMVDGGLMAAGLRVRRADPAQLPPRPAFGSVPADALAEAGVSRLAELTPLVLEDGSLTGRSADHERTSRESDPALTALTGHGRCVVHGPRDEAAPAVALTFDDGPNPPYTGRVLDVLERYGVPATFFCVGLHASAHTEELARMVEAGHGVGNHTWSHPFLPDLSVREFQAQLERTDEAVEAVTGPRPVRLFRPPYGSRSTEIVRWLDDADRPTVALWDVDTDDWAMPGAAAIAGAVLDRARPGSIVLLHDGGGDRSQTAEALPAVIEGLLDRGYRFARVEELLRPGH
jgi:peptidoglycan/xylan/chitin deacetylase (PgdA/CDA1 family)